MVYKRYKREKEEIGMSDELHQFKLDLLATGYFKRRGGMEYSCTCPACNKIDHCYVKFDLSTDSPLVWYCHRCNEKGIINQKFLDYFNLTDLKVPYTRTRKKVKVNKTIDIGKDIQLIDVNNTSELIKIVNYFKYRVGVEPTLQELNEFRCLTEARMYASQYLGVQKSSSYFEPFIWFRLDNGNIQGRNTSDNGEFRWLKFKNNVTAGITGLYSIRKAFDIESEINVCLCEGIFDAIGLYYYNRNEVGINSIYVACLGKNFEAGINSVINRGIFGQSVNIRIYKDSDVSAKSIKIQPSIRKLFKSVSVYENTIGHDYGYPANQIDARKIINIK